MSLYARIAEEKLRAMGYKLFAQNPTSYYDDIRCIEISSDYTEDGEPYLMVRFFEDQYCEENLGPEIGSKSIEVNISDRRTSKLTFKVDSGLYTSQISLSKAMDCEVNEDRYKLKVICKPSQ